MLKIVVFWGVAENSMEEDGEEEDEEGEEGERDFKISLFYHYVFSGHLSTASSSKHT